MTDDTTTPVTLTATADTSSGERWTSRKFWAMVVWEAVMVVLLCKGKLPVDAFVSLTWMILGGYFVSNVTQKIFAPKDLTASTDKTSG